MSDVLVYGADPEFGAVYSKDGKKFILPPVFFRENLGVEFTENVDAPTHPIFFEDKGLGIRWHEDGSAFELSVTPATNWVELFEKIQLAKQILSEKILKYFPGDCLPELESLPAIGYEVDRWNKMGIEWQLCNVFGCDRDKDVFNVEYEGEVIDALKHPWRYLGGHGHFSGRDSIISDPMGAIASLAFTMGLAATAYSPNPELERIRAEMYGKPGRYRVQEYKKLWNDIPNTHQGVEYRTPSVSWTTSKEIATKVFGWAEIGINTLLEKNLIQKLFPMYGQEVKLAISNCDQPLALEILNQIEKEL